MGYFLVGFLKFLIGKIFSVGEIWGAGNVGSRLPKGKGVSFLRFQEGGAGCFGKKGGPGKTHKKKGGPRARPHLKDLRPRGPPLRAETLPVGAPKKGKTPSHQRGGGGGGEPLRGEPPLFFSRELQTPKRKNSTRKPSTEKKNPPSQVKFPPF